MLAAILDCLVLRTAHANPETVVVIVVDTVNRDYLSGFHPTWDTTPRWAEFWDQGTLFANTLSVRGMTSVATSTIQTGTYPRTHGVRNNNDWPLPRDGLPLLAERFGDAGYTTLGYAANACQFLDRGFDKTLCEWIQIDPDNGSLRTRDQALVDQALTDIESQPDGAPVFVWLHLVSPHDPYEPQEDSIDDYYPNPYKGALEPDDELAIADISLGHRDITPQELDYLRASYASELHAVDGMLGQLFDGLDQLGRGDALIALGADHGEELGEHYDYFDHGCSPFQGVMQVAWGLRGPGVPVGQRLDGWVSETDLAPTIIDLAGLQWTGMTEGHSLRSEIDDGVIDDEPVFFERGTEAAGVISGDWKYVRDEESGFTECKPYTNSHPYPGQLDWLGDLRTDPAESQNLQDAEPDMSASLRDTLCTWVTEATWKATEADLSNPLVTNCADDLGIKLPGNGCGCATEAEARPTAWLALAIGLTFWPLRRRPAVRPRR